MEGIKECCEKEGLGSMCSAEYLGHDVNVIVWKKKRRGGQSKTEQRP